MSGTDSGPHVADQRVFGRCRAGDRIVPGACARPARAAPCGAVLRSPLAARQQRKIHSSRTSDAPGRCYQHRPRGLDRPRTQPNDPSITPDLDDTSRYPLGHRCGSCGDEHPSVDVTTATTPLGVLRLTLVGTSTHEQRRPREIISGAAIVLGLEDLELHPRVAARAVGFAQLTDDQWTDLLDRTTSSRTVSDWIRATTIGEDDNAGTASWR